jgi:hypothetical protein
MAKKQYLPTLVIEKCSQCSHCEIERMYTSDSWEEAYNWFCNKDEKKIKIQGYIEWHDKVEVPEWCPLRVKRKKEKLNL